jgi:hypothetical protein
MDFQDSFPSYQQETPGTVIRLKHDRFIPNIFSIHYSPDILKFDAIYSQVRKASQHKQQKLHNLPIL